ncbi:pre-mRNA-splicing factor CWC22 [Aphis craccivora]|uniref:Pre-mRNA-splicing factor CWC22 n=1 Tax=Aphis craccivora TaxID=307492 RepID=A0A6G0YXG2_APHCR|nr:pre-mRNA-splicing factor CWC22 [Aphis craccivora]
MGVIKQKHLWSMFNLYNVKYFIIKFEMKQINLFKFFSDVYQRTVWKRLRAKISYLVSIANSINIGNVKKELLQQNLIRGKHLFCHFIIQAQLTSSSQNTHVYATLVAVINLELPEIGELVLNRFIMKFKSAYFEEHYATWFSCLMFIGHLINHSVADEMLGVELLTLIFEQQTIFSFEIIRVAIQFLEICGKNISYVFQKWLTEMLDKIHNFVNDKQIDIEDRKSLNLRLSKLRDNKFNPKYLDLVPLYACQTTHFSTLDSVENNESYTIGYRYDPEFESNEKKYKLELKKFDNEEESVHYY